jgi:hypothetical protein
VTLHFDLLNDDFTKKLLINYSELTGLEIRLAISSKLGFSNKGILEINNIPNMELKKQNNVF